MVEFNPIQEVTEGVELIDPSGSGLADIVQNLPPEMVNNIGTLIFIFKTLGIVFIAYFLFLLIKGIFAIKTGIRIRKMEKKLNEIDDKLSKVIKGNYKESGGEEEKKKEDKGIKEGGVEKEESKKEEKKKK